MQAIAKNRTVFRQLFAVAMLAGPFLTAQRAVAGKTHLAEDNQLGLASWHAPRGSSCRTASARRWVDTELIAAHRTLPLGSKVRVVNLLNGHSTIVEITDRGPYSRGRIIDVSRRAAVELGFIQAGTVRVRLEQVVGAGW